MKLLLTSGGITNMSIATALIDLVGKSPYDTKIAIIPTALNAEAGGRGSFVGQFLNLWKYGYNWLDIVDPSAADVQWQDRLKEADVIFVTGGNTFHLLNQSRKTGLDKWLNDNLASKIYVGMSAGTIIAAPTIEVASLPIGDENLPGLTDLTGFEWVNFELEPHCTKDRFAAVEEYAKTKPYPVYAIDDQTAIKVVGDKIEVVSEGSWQVYGS
jgi:dipeptidase E